KKSDPLEVEQRNSDYIHKDVLINIISDVLEGKTVKLDTNTVKCEEVVEKWNQMMDMICEDRRKTIFDINDLLYTITRMDSIKDMLNSVHQQTEALHSMSASSE